VPFVCCALGDVPSTFWVPVVDSFRTWSPEVGDGWHVVETRQFKPETTPTRISFRFETGAEMIQCRPLSNHLTSDHSRVFEPRLDPRLPSGTDFTRITNAECFPLRNPEMSCGPSTAERLVTPKSLVRRVASARGSPCVAWASWWVVCGVSWWVEARHHRARLPPVNPARRSTLAGLTGPIAISKTRAPFDTDGLDHASLVVFPIMRRQWDSSLTTARRGQH
jgi:hypothetical protein